MITTMQLLEAKLAASSSDLSTEKIIKELIEEHDTQAMDEGERYYYSENDITTRQRYYWNEGTKIVDETKPNHRLPHGWHKLLVDQKTAYLTGEPLVFQSTAQAEFADFVNDFLDDEWDDTLPELCKGASNKGIEWLHVYIDEVEQGIGEFQYVIIDAREVIPIWETSKQKNLEAVLRYYHIWINGKERIRAEWWTKDTVAYYIQGDNGHFVLDSNGNEVAEEKERVNIAPASHYYLNGVGYGWGKVPFIPFRNNGAQVSDLSFIKTLIDSYDLSLSDLANNLDEVQDVVWVLKNYAGTDLQEFTENLRYFKALKTDGDGGAETITIAIPVEARREFLDRLEENLFMFGQGVNVKTDRFGNSPSGIALKFLYALLDMKANVLERKFRRAIRELLWFIAEYVRITQHKEYDPWQVQVTFAKSPLMNDAELVTMVQNSIGIISRRTAIANHPFVENVDDELDRLKEEQAEAVNLDDVDIDDDEMDEEGDEE